MPSPTVSREVDLPSSAEAIDAFLVHQAPLWLKGAAPEALEALRVALRQHCALQAEVARVLQGIQPLDAFAGPLLGQALSLLGVSVDPARASWREVRAWTSSLMFITQDHTPESLRRYHEDSNLLQRALQNFTVEQSETGGHLAGSGIYVHGLPTALPAERFAGLCRALDLGEQYQQHLDKVFDGPAGEASPVLALLAAEQRNRLEVQARMSLLKAQIGEETQRMLLQAAAGRGLVSHGGHPVRICTVQLFGYRVGDALVFEVFEVRFVAQYKVRQLVLYLPNDRRPLREYPSWQALTQTLEHELQAADVQAALLARLSLAERVPAQVALADALRRGAGNLALSAVPETQASGTLLARQRIARIKADAAFLAVPTAAVDLAAYRERMQAYQRGGLSLAMLVASFVPGLAQVMLAASVVELLETVYEGVQDWRHGHRSEALEHLLGVVQTGLLLGAGAATVIALKRSAFVDGLVPVLLDDEGGRLWHLDLAPYARTPAADVQRAGVSGVAHNGTEQRWLAHAERHYKVSRSHPLEHWQIIHPQRPQAYRPTLLHNGESAWRWPGEQPVQWHELAPMLRSCTPLAEALTADECAQLLGIAGVDSAWLRGVLAENRTLPAGLRDVLEHNALDRRVGRFLEQLPSTLDDSALDAELYRHALTLLDGPIDPTLTPRQWLRAGLADLRGGLFATAWRSLEGQATTDAEVLLQRDFPGLPRCYVGELLEHAELHSVQSMLLEQRVPLVLAEQARLKLQEARLIRALLGLKLRHGCYSDSARLLLVMLRSQPGWPAGLNLELREGSPFGRLLEGQLALAERRQTRLLVQRQQGFELYDEQGHPLAGALPQPAGLFDAVAACLDEGQRLALGWAGQEGREHMRQAVLTEALAARERAARSIGLQPPRSWLQPWQRLADGRPGYPLSGRGGQGNSSLIASVRALFPTFDTARAEAFLAELRGAEGGVLEGLLGYQRQARSLDQALNRWLNGSGATSASARRRFAGCLRRCWRREGEPLPVGAGGPGYRLQFNNTELPDLPLLPATVNFRHVVHLDLAGTGLGMNAERFLQGFGGVRQLNLSRCQLSDVPQALAGMADLAQLYLNGNRIQLSPAGNQCLRSLRRLEVLNLNHNPLGDGLDLGGLHALREVMLRNTRIQALPVGLLDIALLHVADLRSNAISELPAAFFSAPRARQAAIALHDNPLSAQTLVQLGEQHLGFRPGLHVSLNQGLGLWLGNSPPALRNARGQLWAHLEGEHDSAHFLRLLADLGTTAEYQRAREQLSARVWQMLETAGASAQLRQELFDLAAQPTTCADSVIATFSTLEVRLHLHQALASASTANPRPVLLRLARQLFRLEQVEAQAAALIAERRAAGRAVDEVEVRLAYRIGLAPRLDLPGQPSNMRYADLAQVTPQQLQAAEREVRRAEVGEALARFVSTRDFWRSHLREVHGAAFERLQQRFWRRLDVLAERAPALGEGAYLEEMKALTVNRQMALDALALRFTEDALRREVSV